MDLNLSLTPQQSSASAPDVPAFRAPIQPTPKPVAAPAASPTSSSSQLDPQVVNLAKAIRQHETGGRWKATGGSGESGAYQWMPGTWKDSAKQYLGDPNAPMTPDNQNQVAYKRIKDWKDQGYKPDQIASLWNHGSANYQGVTGVNNKGVKYDVPAYVNSVMKNYQKIKGENSYKPPIQPAPAGEKKSGGFMGFLGGLAKDIARPFVETGVTGAAAVQSAGQLLSGNQAGAEKTLSEGYNVPGFGQIKPLQIGRDVDEQMATGKGPFSVGTTGKVIGTGAEIASTLAGGGEAAPAVGKDLVKGAFKQALKTGAKEGAMIGGAQAFGSALKDQPANRSGLSSAADVAVKTLGGTVLGAGLGAIAPAAGLTMKSAYRTFVPEARELLTSAIKPVGKVAQDFDKHLGDALPALEKYVPQIKDLRSLDTAIRAAKVEVWDKVKQAVARGQMQGAEVSGKGIAQGIRALADKFPKLKIEDPAALEKLESLAKAYEGKTFDPVQAEELLEHTNAELDTFYSSPGTKRESLRKTNPVIAANEEIARVIREDLDQMLYEKLPGEFGDLKKQYGALRNVGDQVAKRIPVVERQNLTSLAEQIATARAAGNAGINLAMGRPIEAISSVAEPLAAKAMKYLEKSDTKVNRAFRALEAQTKKAEGEGFIQKAAAAKSK